MVVAGRVTGADEVAIMMVEAEAPEHTVRLVGEGATAPTEEVVAAGLEAAKPFIRTLVAAQAELAGAAAKPVAEFPTFPEYGDEVLAAVEEAVSGELAGTLTISAKQEREAELDRLKRLAAERVGEQLRRAGRRRSPGRSGR